MPAACSWRSGRRPLAGRGCGSWTARAAGAALDDRGPVARHPALSGRASTRGECGRCVRPWPGWRRRCNPVEVRAGPAPRALGPGVWVLPVERARRRWPRRVGAATADLGQPPAHRPYRGHLTLARARRPAALAGLALPAGSTPGARRGGGPVGGWRISAWCAARSGADGARYEVVARWPLGGGAG